MHPALEIPEIVHEIISKLRLIHEETLLDRFIPYSSSWSKNRADVLAVGLTCKLFCEYALDEVWSMMTTLVPLFKIISNFVDPTPMKVRSDLWLFYET